MPRTPDEIMEDFADGVMGLNDTDPYVILWEIIEDILDSVKLACTTYDENRRPHPESQTVDHIFHTVSDYITNHYGDK